MPPITAERRPLRPWRRGALVLLASLAVGWGATAAEAGPSAATTTRIQGLVSTQVRELAQKKGPGDPQVFRGGEWHNADPGCWTCDLGPGTAAAVLAGDLGVRWARGLAIGTFDRAIVLHRNANGSFGDAADSPDLTTMFFGLELGHAYLALAPAPGTVRATRWRRALIGAADYLIANGNLRWYTNGNINIGNTALFHLAWRATGSTRFLAAYRRSWDFTLHPPQDRWPRFGLRITRAPHRADGSDGAAYLAESGGGAPGFDAEYTAVQLSVVTRLYLESGDRRALRLANLLMNQLLPRIDARWFLDTSGGTRHPEPNRTVPFMSPAVATLAWHGGRADLAARLPAQVSRIVREYTRALTYSHRNMYRGVGDQLSVLLVAAGQKPGGSPTI